MSETTEIENEFAGDPAETPDHVASNQEEAAPTADNPKIQEAVARALAEGKVTQVELAPCPCGVPGVNLLIDLPQGSKVGRAGCSACGVWGVDFLAPRTQNQELVGQAAGKAWNEAPRG